MARRLIGAKPLPETLPFRYDIVVHYDIVIEE